MRVAYLGLGLAAFSALPPAFASPLPYSARSRSYSGYHSSVGGDIRTVGMAGATIGGNDSFLGAVDNPAALAMTMPDLDLNFARNDVEDRHLQDPGNPVAFTSAGFTFTNYPWGFAIGYLSPYQETQENSPLPSAPADPLRYSVGTREFRLGAAHYFEEGRFSVGAMGILAQGTRSLEFDAHPADNQRLRSYALGVSIGALARLPHRILAGVSYTPPMRLEADPALNPSPGLPGAFRDIDIPAQLGFGTAWAPNRFFRLGITTWLVGRTLDASLLRDDATVVGKRWTLQPRIGASYTFLDFPSLQGSVFSGAYYESSRIESSPSRFHATGGLEAKIWIVGLGTGLDLARDYKNVLVSVGIDLVKLFEFLELLPPLPHALPGGFLPPPFMETEEGMPRPMRDEWDPEDESLDPVAVARDLPSRILRRVGRLRDEGPEGFAEESSGPIERIPEIVRREMREMKRVQLRRDRERERRRERELEARKKKKAKPGPKPSPSPSVKPKTRRR